MIYSLDAVCVRDWVDETFSKVNCLDMIVTMIKSLLGPSRLARLLPGRPPY